MSRFVRSKRLMKNAEAALISSIEVYNKPTFAYREETFAILALNAWELLLNSKLLAVNDKQTQLSLCLFCKNKLHLGNYQKKQYVKRNRTGNSMTPGD